MDPLIKHDHLCHDHWRNSEIVGQPTYQPGDHVHFDQVMMLDSSIISKNMYIKS